MQDLISFTGNLLGPVMIGMLLQSGLAVAFFNILLFFIAVEIACTIPGMDRYRLVFLLVVCAETAPALVTLNKEILVLLSTILFVKYIYSEKRSWLLLGVALWSHFCSMGADRCDPALSFFAQKGLLLRASSQGSYR